MQKNLFLKRFVFYAYFFDECASTQKDVYGKRITDDGIRSTVGCLSVCIDPNGKRRTVAATVLSYSHLRLRAVL